MTLDHRKYGLFLTMGNAGFISSTVSGPSHEVPAQVAEAPKGGGRARRVRAAGAGGGVRG